MKSVRTRLVFINALLLASILLCLSLLLRARIEGNLLADLDSQLSAEAGSAHTTGLAAGDTQTLAEHVKRSTRVPGALQMSLASGEPVSTSHADTSLNLHGGHGQARSIGKARIVELMQSQNGAVRMEATRDLPQLIPVPFVDVQGGQGSGVDIEGYRRAVAARRETYNDYAASGRAARSLSVPVQQHGQVVAVVQVARLLSGIQLQMRDLDRGLWMLAPVAIAASLFGGFVFVGSAMRPLRRLVESARRLEPDMASERLPVSGGDEFSELAAALNAACDRTADAFEHQRKAFQQLERFTGDAGHELRTPLGAAKGAAGYLLHMSELGPECRSLAEVIDRSTDRMARLIDDLLLLARQDAGRAEISKSETDLPDLVRSVIDQVPGRPGIEVAYVGPEDCTAFVDAAALERVLVNLLANAVSYACSAARIELSMLGSPSITIADDGEGIPPEHLARLGERFYRPDASRARGQGGTGLGLAIVKSLCVTNGWAFDIRSEVGVGSSAKVDLSSPWGEHIEQAL